METKVLKIELFNRYSALKGMLNSLCEDKDWVLISEIKQEMKLIEDLDKSLRRWR